MLYLVVMALGLVAASAAAGQPKFRASLLEARSTESIYCDLDADGLEDILLRDRNHISVFYQDPSVGFNPRPDTEFDLAKAPGVLWSAALGGKGSTLLLATSNGVSELCFTNRTTSPVWRPLIRQATVIPAGMEREPSSVVRFPLSVGRTNEPPLILLPVAGQLEVWQRRSEWQAVQKLTGVAEAHVWPMVRAPGYGRVLELNLSVGELNGDGYEDLMVRRVQPNGEHTYRFFPQRPDGTFASEPVMSYTEAPDPDSWLCWVDVNRDGRPDLVKGIASGEPWFLPGTQSRKVLVGVYVADAQGRIPARPQYVFRKSDAMAVVPVTDIDGDGYPDLALGSASADTREEVRQMITAKQFPLTLKLHFYRPGIGFAATPDCQALATFGLDQRSLSLAGPNAEYLQRVGNFYGDFDGDGKKDLLVRESSDEISVYRFISREQGFSRERLVRFDCGDVVDGFAVRDLNGDGISDLVVRTQKPNSVKVFTSYR